MGFLLGGSCSFLHLAIVFEEVICYSKARDPVIHVNAG